MDELFDLRVGHVLDRLRELPEASVHCAVTSPPYYGLREYEGDPVVWGGDSGHDHEWIDVSVVRKGSTQGRTDMGSTLSSAGSRKTVGSGEPNTIGETKQYREDRASSCSCGAWRGQLGLEPTPSLFIEHLVAVFQEVRRVLRDDGSVWVNLGDSYAEKQLLGMPWRFAFAMKDAGWILRSENIWRKLGSMPESVFDRTAREHEQVFHFTKAARYFFDADAVREPYAPDNRRKTKVRAGPGSHQHRDGERWPHPEGRIWRSVWEMPTANYQGSHFAVFPVELPDVCIRASTSEKGVCAHCGAPWRRVVEAEGESVEKRQARQHERYHELTFAPRSDGGALQRGLSVTPPGMGERRTVGWEPTCRCRDRATLTLEGQPSLYPVVPATVLDPFVGSGTTMVAARRAGRRSIGIELSERYAREETTRRLESWWKDESRPRVLEGQATLFDVGG